MMTTPFDRTVPEWLERLDRWRGKQIPTPSRAEAVRSMVTARLAMMKED